MCSKSEAIEQFKKLVRSLANVGLQTEVRNGDETSLLVFVRAADEKIFGDVVYRSRLPTKGPKSTYCIDMTDL